MQKRLQPIGYIFLGMAAGALLSPVFFALAQDARLPVEHFRSIAEAFARMKRDYVDPLDDKNLAQQCISGMVSGIDPESSYLDADAFKELRGGTAGDFAALGLEVGMEDGFVKIVTPLDDSPALRAGLRAGDLIVKIDDTPTKGMRLIDAVKRMRGKPNTDITLTIARKGEPKPLVITATRAVIRIQSVKSKLIEPGYAYVRLSQFQEISGAAMVSQLNNLYKQGNIDGLILDLRNNPGGLFNGAVAVSAAFLPQNSLVVYTDGRTDDAKMRLTASPENYLRGRDAEDYMSKLPPEIKNVPMVVLVNAGSAAASEIVAGALQDHKRAIVMGIPTFGRASIQTILPLADNSALKLTTARWFTPNGRTVAAKGIVPDVPSPAQVEPAQFGSNSDQQLTQAVALLKSRR